MEVETKVIRVKPTVKLPHSVKIGHEEYHFMPHAQVPKKWAEGVLLSRPDLYEEATGKASGEYEYKEQFKNQTLIDLIETLSDEEKAQIFKMADDFRIKKQKAEMQNKLDADNALLKRAQEIESQAVSSRNKAEREAKNKRKGDTGNENAGTSDNS
jgi:hypothetical protein